MPVFCLIAAFPFLEPGGGMWRGRISKKLLILGITLGKDFFRKVKPTEFTYLRKIRHVDSSKRQK